MRSPVATRVALRVHEDLEPDFLYAQELLQPGGSGKIRLVFRQITES
jgi:hypothetical protein